jgi:hypothetical protein
MDAEPTQIGPLSPRLKQPWREADHSAQSNADFKNVAAVLWLIPTGPNSPLSSNSCKAERYAATHISCRNSPFHENRYVRHIVLHIGSYSFHRIDIGTQSRGLKRNEQVKMAVGSRNLQELLDMSLHRNSSLLFGRKVHKKVSKQNQQQSLSPCPRTPPWGTIYVAESLWAQKLLQLQETNLVRNSFHLTWTMT